MRFSDRQYSLMVANYVYHQNLFCEDLNCSACASSYNYWGKKMSFQSWILNIWYFQHIKMTDT